MPHEVLHEGVTDADLSGGRPHAHSIFNQLECSCRSGRIDLLPGFVLGASLANHIGAVFGGCPHEEMGGVEARRCVTVVEDLETGHWIKPVPEHCCETVNKPHFPFVECLPVSLALARHRPQPAPSLSMESVCEQMLFDVSHLATIAPGYNS